MRVTARQNLLNYRILIYHPTCSGGPMCPPAAEFFLIQKDVEEFYAA
jgi:hypothetical protein